jgi:YidC/Oxa1 family membrane protein insertase
VTMEQRVFLAVALMAALLILYQAFMVQPTPPEAPQRTDQPAGGPEPERKPPTPPLQPPATKPVVAAPQKPREPELITRVITPLYEALLSNDGGRLQDWTIYYRGLKPMILDIPQAEVTAPGATPGIDGPSASEAVVLYGPLGLVVAEGSRSQEPVLKMPTDPVELRAGNAPREVVMQAESAGLALRYTLAFSPESYLVDARVRVENRTSASRSINVGFPWLAFQKWPPTGFEFQGQFPSEITASARGEFRRTDDLAHPGWHYGCLSTLFGPTKQGERLDLPADPGNWIGIGSNWYLAALIARSAGFQMTATPLPDEGLGGRVLVSMNAAPTVAPGAMWDGHIALYIGPKEYEQLRALGLEESIHFGGFPLPTECGGLPMRWVGVPILLLMKWMYAHLGNYGVAIILLTVLSKILFYPLTVKSMRSMKAMQALQPQINALRNKYRKDPHRLQQETMNLYRQHKINPLGGCLPMLAQVPIFYALYLAFSNAVDLQGAEFLCFGVLDPVAAALRWFGMYWVHGLWICNLAEPDPLYVLPILMGVTMFVQQKMTPVAGDPRQAKMMLIMPFIFTIMFLNLPSGLVLYWTVSNVLQILQQWYMDRPAARMARQGSSAGRA